MGKKKRHKRKGTPRLKIPKFTKKGKVKMTQQFTVGQRVRFTYNEHTAYASLAPNDGAAVKIIDFMKHPLQLEYRYLVKFPTGPRAWVPEESLSVLGNVSCPKSSVESTDTRREVFSMLTVSFTDCWGYPAKVRTFQRLHLHEGWVTEVSHQAYNDGEPVIVSFCYTAKRARKMHQEWYRALFSGPLPEEVTDAALGTDKDKGPTYQRASWYKTIPLMS